MSSFAGPTGSSRKLSGTGYNQVTMPTLSPEQQQLFQQLLGGASGGIQSGLGNLSKLAAGDQSQFAEMEAPALRQFNALQGNIASRFSGMGSGARRSSGFNQASSSAASQFSQDLQSRRLDFQQQAIRDLLGIGQNLLGRDTFNTALLPKKRSGWQSFLEGISPALGSLSSGAGNIGLAKAFGLF